MNTFHQIYVCENDSCSIDFSSSRLRFVSHKDYYHATENGIPFACDSGLHAKIYNSKGKFYDWCSGSSHAPVVKEHVKESLECVLGDLVQWIGPLDISGSVAFVMNCMNIKDACLEGSSHNKVYFDSEVIKNEIIFRPTGFLSYVYVRSDLRDLIHTLGHSGVRFGWIDEKNWRCIPF